MKWVLPTNVQQPQTLCRLPGLRPHLSVWLLLIGPQKENWSSDGWLVLVVSLTHLGRRIVSIRLASRHVCRAWSLLMIDVGGLRSQRAVPPWASGLRLYKRAGWVWAEGVSQWASSSRASAFAPASRYQPWVPALWSWCLREQYGKN